MKPATRLQLNAPAASAGASWRLVRESRHLVIDFTKGEKTVRLTLATTPSDQRAVRNITADLRMAFRRWWVSAQLAKASSRRYIF